MPWEDIAKRQAGVVSHAQLISTGLSTVRAESLIRRGHLVRRVKGVYLVRGAPETYDAALWTAALGTGGVLGFHTACHLWQMLDEAPTPIVVLVDEPRRVRPPDGVQVRRRSSAFPATERLGLPVTTRADSLFDHLGTLSIGKARTLFDRGRQQAWFTEQDLQSRLTVPRWGNGTLRELSKLLGDGAHAESERLLHRLLRQHGIGGWQANLRIEVRGSVCYIDVAFPSRRLAIEIDGMAWHSTPDRFQRDRTRQNALVASGWRVLRFTWWDLVERPGYVVGLIASELAAAS